MPFTMNTVQFLPLVLACAWFKPILGDTVTPWIVEQQLSPSLFIPFTITREAVIAEIERRTSEGNACDSVVRDQLMTLVNTTDDPIVEMFFHINPADGNLEGRRDEAVPMVTALKFFVAWEKYSLGLAYFTLTQDRSEVSDNPYKVDEITLSDDNTLLTVTKGNDRLRVALDWSKGECESDGTMHKYTSPNFYNSWYPFKFDEICPDPFCQSPLLEPHLCGIHRAGGDVCYVEKLVGRSCGFSATISEMTGVFRERSLITADASWSSNVSHYFEGIRKVGFSYPCINHRQTCS